MSVNENIEKLIEAEFKPTYFVLQDDSAKHAGHAGTRESGGGHYGVFVVSRKFEGHSLIKRHRMIYKCVETLKSDIHALVIKALTPEEFAHHDQVS